MSNADDHSPSHDQRTGSTDANDVGDADAVWLELLERGDCLRLLATQSYGRFAYSPDDGPPEVVPVNFVLDGDVITFRTGAGALVRATLAEKVSFQADAVDPVHHTGWSVLVHGPATASDHWDSPGIPLHSWAPGDKDFWVRVRAEQVTGRRLRLVQLPPDLRLRHGYR